VSAALALCAAPADDDRLEEYLRCLVGLLAAGCDVVLQVVGAGEGLSAEDPALAPEAETYLEALGAAGIRPRRASPAEVVEALAAHADVLCLAPADRAGDPAVLRIDAARLARAAGDPEGLLQAMLSAGQVVRLA
jgi:hypothetical protein